MVQQPAPPCLVRHLGLTPYEPVFTAMKSFADERLPDTRDEIWLLQHYPVYTQGMSCRSQPRTEACGIPLIKTDRGGQITYHGPGQIIVYLLMDIKRRRWGPKFMVGQLERAVIDLLADYDLTGSRREKAPGVYVDNAKIAALGLRFRRGTSYHGLSLNVDVDLTPFQAIDPCGYADLAVTRLKDLGVHESVERIGDKLLMHMTNTLDIAISQ